MRSRAPGRIVPTASAMRISAVGPVFAQSDGGETAVGFD